ncbi:uncharacterized protein LOC128982981 [Macrosteles quadrilineatus]|uniref:uncharacterized protein LOC128982981 n=1 Tax=Macrosteles quadrilineatus TaxID=74068 RepID=UPI0023E1BFAA|nr:uncharacterized protein LOC128982981 [Macrosteles quadrilineatus]
MYRSVAARPEWTIERYEGGDATELVRDIQQRRRELHDNCRVEQWLTDHDVAAYVLYEEGRALAFALLSGYPADPRSATGHKHPRFLNYIYTVEAQRNRGLASALLRRVKQHDEVTAVCWNDISERIFYKAGYYIQEIVNATAVYRYP